MTRPKHAWMVRAGNDNEFTGILAQDGAVAIGWMEMGDVSGLHSSEEFKERYRRVFPQHSAGRVAVYAGQIHRFAQEIQEGDHLPELPGV